MTLDAPTKEAALEQLYREGYFVLSLQQQSKQSQAHPFLAKFQKVKQEELVAFSREFSVMIKAGLPLVETLETMQENMRPGALRQAVEKIQQEVTAGVSLSESIERRGSIFPKLYLNLVKAAEVSGNLDQMLKRAADYMHENLALQRKIKSAMMYPAVVMVATMFAMAYMIVFIMPKFSEMFKQMNVPLPITTQLLVTLGDLGDKQKWLVLASPLLILAMAWGAWQVEKIREPLSYAIARLPMVGDLTRKIVIVRSLSAMQTLLSAGVSLSQTLDIAGDSSGDRKMRAALEKVKQDVESGQPMASSLRETGRFPGLVVQLVTAGERAGMVPEMMQQIVEFYDDEVQQRLKGLTSVLEPMMMLFLGLVIGIFAVSVISPIYNLMGQIK
ncbi:MAG: type II secretion system F family protein [Fimbriimonadia bacterium]|nr:type II secretion system F family protein [Fimbriimonadia bacterium]